MKRNWFIRKGCKHGRTQSLVYLDAYQYKELVSRSTKLEMLERAYKELKSYEIDAILKTIFGGKEEAC